MENFEPSGRLFDEINTVNGIALKYNGVDDACLPQKDWKLFVFKENELVKTVPLQSKSFFLIGKESKVVDILTEHPSCSRQHSVIQFRPKGPYIMDLESSNGTFLNNEKIRKKRFYELRSKDIIKFGGSTREYVLVCDIPE